MKLKFASVYHPQSNGAVERANGVIFSAIKKCLNDQPKGKWVDELPKVVWSHNTTPTRATNFSPFKLLYGEDAMTPDELRAKSLRVEAQLQQDERIDKDLLEAYKLEASENLEKYQQETRSWRDKKARIKSIKPGDFVLRRTPVTEAQGKMEPKWDGPFLVLRSSKMGAFKLMDDKGVELPHSWNVDNLRKFYR